jgi:hypothetical protein
MRSQHHTTLQQPVPHAAPAADTPAGSCCSELELQKTGVQGAYIIDDARKYPAKENVGPLLGATGGFAGGEKGIKQLVQVRALPGVLICHGFCGVLSFGVAGWIWHA